MDRQTYVGVVSVGSVGICHSSEGNRKHQQKPSVSLDVVTLVDLDTTSAVRNGYYGY